MIKATEYIDLIAEANPTDEGKPASDYRVGKLLKLSSSVMSKYRLHGNTFDDVTAARVAELLDMPAEIVIADMHYQRAKKKGNKQVMEAWTEISKKVSGTAAGIMLGITTLLPNQADAAQFNITPVTASFYDSSIIYIMPLLVT